MPSFTYTARDARGELKTATIDATSREDAIAPLKPQRLNVVKVDEKVTKKKAGKIKMREIVIFTRQFSTMINAGLPLVQALDILAKQSENANLKDDHAQVVFDVESGNTVADALRKHPKAFSDLYVNMVAAGEAGGILDTILMRLAMFMEKNDALVRKVKGAMIYPGVIMSVAAIAITVLLVFVIPMFERMFAEAGIPLPLPTRIVIGLSGFLTRTGGPSSPPLWVRSSCCGTTTPHRTDKLVIDRLLLKMPVLGDVLRKSAVSRFTRTLGTLIGSGVSILDGLEITAKTAGNRVIQDAIMESRASIAGGETISAPLKKSQVFPPMVISMIAVGEQTGGLDEMLVEDRRLLRRRSGRGGVGAAVADGADHDRVPRRRRRRHGRRDVPADLRHDQRGRLSESYRITERAASPTSPALFRARVSAWRPHSSVFPALLPYRRTQASFRSPSRCLEPPLSGRSRSTTEQPPPSTSRRLTNRSVCSSAGTARADTRAIRASSAPRTRSDPRDSAWCDSTFSTASVARALRIPCRGSSAASHPSWRMRARCFVRQG